MTELSEKITAAIEASGLTGRAVAELLGLDESTVSLWMSGGRTPRVKNLEKLARALGKETADFWSGPVAMPASAACVAVLDDMAQLPPVQQEALAAIARSMREALPKP